MTRRRRTILLLVMNPVTMVIAGAALCVLLEALPDRAHVSAVGARWHDLRNPYDPRKGSPRNSRTVVFDEAPDGISVTPWTSMMATPTSWGWADWGTGQRGFAAPTRTLRHVYLSVESDDPSVDHAARARMLTAFAEWLDGPRRIPHQYRDLVREAALAPEETTIGGDPVTQARVTQVRPLLLGYAWNAGLVAAAVVLIASLGWVVVIPLQMRRTQRLCRGACARCGYDLSGINGPCPECGAEVAG